MVSIFNYNTLQVSLEKETRSLTVSLNRPEHDNCINREMLFELEGLFAWHTSHLEINSILLTSKTDFFSKGFDRTELEKMNEAGLQRFLLRFQKLVYSMFFLPQTIIVDMKNEACNEACELAIGADIRIARENCKIHFNHLHNGYVPCGGGIGFLGAIIPKNFVRNWVLSSSPSSSESLKASGYIHKFYPKDSNITLKKLLTSISAQSPVSRIQTKRSILESLMPELDRALHFETKLAFGGLKSGDWKNSKGSFHSAREFSSRL